MLRRRFWELWGFLFGFSIKMDDAENVENVGVAWRGEEKKGRVAG